MIRCRGLIIYCVCRRPIWKLKTLTNGSSAVVQCFFFFVNIKSAREPHFFGFVHGHFFAFTGRNFGKSSRVLFAVYEHFFGKKLQKNPTFRCWAVGRGSRTLSLEMFTATLEVYGQFLPFQFTVTFLRFTGEKNTAVVWLSFWFSTRFNLKISVPSNGRNRLDIPPRSSWL